MKKVVTGALAALTLGGAVLGAAAPASADPRHHGYYRGVSPGVAVGAGLLGLAVGASIADRPHYVYAAPPPPPPRYYYYDGGCRTQWRWDPYAYRYVPVEYCY